MYIEDEENMCVLMAFVFYGKIDAQRALIKRRRCVIRCKAA